MQPQTYTENCILHDKILFHKEARVSNTLANNNCPSFPSCSLEKSIQIIWCVWSISQSTRSGIECTSVKFNKRKEKYSYQDPFPYQSCIISITSVDASKKVSQVKDFSICICFYEITSTLNSQIDFPKEKNHQFWIEKKNIQKIQAKVLHTWL